MFVDRTDWLQLMARLGLAMAVGAVIGWNRQHAGKAAGLRTHMLVAMGACLFVLVPLTMDNIGSDALSRVIQGVVVGMGFLGGGEIVQSIQTVGGKRVTGLTSAAALWLTAALGVAAGCGLWRMIVIAAAAAMLVLAVAKRAERVIFPAKDQDDVE
jgi:putative Mg2+ transporter-C (MgtC) family protein